MGMRFSYRRATVANKSEKGKDAELEEQWPKGCKQKKIIYTCNKIIYTTGRECYVHEKHLNVNTNYGQGRNQY
jgi:hypothetical protein